MYISIFVTKCRCVPGSACKANACIKMHDTKPLNLKHFRGFIIQALTDQVEGLCTSNLSTRALLSASVNIGLSVHMCWQEAICKPNSLLSDKKSHFSLTKKKRKGKPEEIPTKEFHYHVIPAACEGCLSVSGGDGGGGGAGGYPTSLLSHRLSLTHAVMLRIFFDWCVSAEATCPGAVPSSWTPGSPVGIRDDWLEIDTWKK